MSKPKKAVKAPAKKKSINPVKLTIGILFDPCASMNMTPEEEYDQAVEWFNGQLEYQLDGHYIADPYQLHCFDTRQVKPGTKAILFDFGGMLGAYDLAASNCRELVRFATDNPSVMVMVTSSYTWHTIFKYEMREMGFEELPNVCSQCDCNYELPQWFVDMVK